MSVGPGNLAFAPLRREDRDEVHYRARVFAAGAAQHSVLVVNLSPHGLMGRCDSCFEAGERIEVQLPAIGLIAAEIRWSLGGRLGAQFETAIDPDRYREMSAALLRK